jgi:hypothetical protein
VLVDEKVELKKLRPFLYLIWFNIKSYFENFISQIKSKKWITQRLMEIKFQSNY